MGWFRLPIAGALAMALGSCGPAAKQSAAPSTVPPERPTVDMLVLSAKSRTYAPMLPYVVAWEKFGDTPLQTVTNRKSAELRHKGWTPLPKNTSTWSERPLPPTLRALGFSKGRYLYVIRIKHHTVIKTLGVEAFHWLTLDPRQLLLWNYFRLPDGRAMPPPQVEQSDDERAEE